MDILYSEGGEALAQAAKKCCGYPIPGGIQLQAGWGPGQPGLVFDMEVGSPACGRGLELDDPWSPFQPKPFYDTMIPRDTAN